MATTSLILLLVVGTSCSIHARFVKKVLPNQFEIELEERGTRFTQKVRFDEGGNLRITEVPNHNDINGATFIFDKSTGLQLDVVNATRSCFLHQPFFTLSNKDEESILDTASIDQDEVDGYLELKHEDTLDIELISVKGPMLYREEIPPQLAKHCFEDFEFFAMKQVQKNSYNLHHAKNEDNRVLIENPQLQEEIKFDEPLDFSDLFKVLPMRSRATHPKVPRVKRSLVNDTCQSWCDGAGGHYCTFTNSELGWDYILMCPRPRPGQNCWLHVRVPGRMCHPCCQTTVCARLPTCNSIREKYARVELQD